MSNPFILIAPSTRGLSLALTRHYLRTTNLPVYATHRSGSAEETHKNILSTLSSVNGERLTMLPLDLTSESSIEKAATMLAEKLPKDSESYLQTGFFAGGILHPERQPSEIEYNKMLETFQINVLSHLLLIKHFSRFLPSARVLRNSQSESKPSKWVHVTARVGSIGDNTKGGWYSYRASKAALAQVVRTFDNQLKMHKTPSVCIGVHPGTMKTDLSKDYWDSVPKESLHEPEDAAKDLADVVSKITEEQRGKVWDYAGRQVPW